MAGAGWGGLGGVGPGTASGSPLPTLSSELGLNSSPLPEVVLDSASCPTLWWEKLPHRFCI